MDDFELLQRYVEQGSMESLDALIRRHLAMVHAAALRQVVDPHLAEDVTQAVFVELMRCARRISSRAILAGWLFTTTRFVAYKFCRARTRRAHHEVAAGAYDSDAHTV